MRRAPLTYCRRPWPKEKLARLPQIELRFHVRVFGEELARVNFDLTIDERHRYLGRMRELAREHGVPPARPRQSGEFQRGS